MRKAHGVRPTAHGPVRAAPCCAVSVAPAPPCTLARLGSLTVSWFPCGLFNPKGGSVLRRAAPPLGSFSRFTPTHTHTHTHTTPNRSDQPPSP
jgi:hypothetical protein